MARIIKNNNFYNTKKGTHEIKKEYVLNKYVFKYTEILVKLFFFNFLKNK